MWKLLIVDDSNIIRRKIERSVFGRQFNVVGLAKNGLDAVNKLDRLDPQVVTMDLTMPEMDGIQCIENIISKNKQIRILVVSALSDIATGIEALEKGARGFLCKPFSDEQLVSALEELTEGLDV